jgi:uncharacterized protein (TIGR02147 family)
MSTPVIFDYLDYKEYLNKMADSQPRGFKKKIAELSGCQTAYVSHVLNGHAHFSWEQAEAISTGIGHSEDEKEYFLLVLNYSNAGTPSLKKFIKARLDRIREVRLSIKERVKVKETLSREDQAKYYSAWYYAAVHVLLTIPRFQNKDLISTYLKISPKLTTEVLDFLMSVGLAVKSGNKFVAGSAKIHLEKSSPLISKHHTNWRMLAIRSFENEVDDDLHFSSVFTLTEKDASQIRDILLKSIEHSVSIIKDAKEDVAMAMTLDFFKI